MRNLFLTLIGVRIVFGSLNEDIFDTDLHKAAVDSELCQQHLIEVDIYRYYDVSFRVPQGLLGGNLVNYGNYFQCLNLREIISNGETIEGKHCVFAMPDEQVNALDPKLKYSSNDKRLKDPHKFSRIYLENDVQERSSIDELFFEHLKLGICVPKSCSLDVFFESTNSSIISQSKIGVAHCRLSGDKRFTIGDYFAITILSALGLITLVGTSYELFYIFIKKVEPVNQMVYCWSAYRNTIQLFTFKARKAGVDRPLECLDGIRSLSIMWVILGHSFIKILFANIVNMFEIIDWYYSDRALYMAMANISVDTFLMLSGLLAVYTLIPKVTQKSLTRSIPLLYLNRMLRMFPLLGVMVLLQATLLHHVYDGPNWMVESSQVVYCRKYWWSTLLYVMNYVNPLEECLHHTWYLSVDVQLHIISPLVLFWALGSKRSAWIGLVGAVLLSLTINTVICFLGNYAPNTITIHSAEAARYKQYYYMNTATRAPVFFIGMLFGYILHCLRNKRLIMSKISVTLGWLWCFGALSAVAYTFRQVNHFDYANQTLINVSNSFKRSLWSLGLGWLIVACVHGYGGPINWFLSLKIWKFVSRISYAMYIVHYPMQFLFSAAAPQPIFFSVQQLWFSFYFDLALTILISIFACVVIDAPFSTMQRKFISFLTGQHKMKPQLKQGHVIKNGDLQTTEENQPADIKRNKTSTNL